MRYTIASIAFAALAAAAPQAPASTLAPSAPAPSGCSPNYSGQFTIAAVNVTQSGSSKAKRQNSDDTTLMITLNNGILKDAKNRQGEVVANHQFQFDSPLQAGALYTAGFSACSNGSLALGGSAIFYQCLSGGFYNLYDQSQGGQCSPIYLVMSGAGSTSGVASQQSDGQVTATPVSSRPVTQLTDGQPGAGTSATAKPISQISDGQIQASTKATISSVTARPISQISDGQIQASTSAPKPTVAPVSQISDGQIQAPKPTSTGRVVSQMSDGQIIASKTNGTVASPTASVVAYTGAAVPNAVSGGLLGMGALLAFALL
ncbi:hypothetical protein LTR86_007367 [Recurvomyces mirabilis]|nr:hypothetical protein LTR86_007367 [Recurvomyces mirabilis]